MIPGDELQLAKNVVNFVGSRMHVVSSRMPCCGLTNAASEK